MKRIEITEKAAKLIERLQAEFRKRKIPQQEFAKLISEALLGINQKTWDEQIENLTPDSYLLESALQDIRIQKSVLEFLKNRKSKESNPESEIEQS